MPQGNGAMNLPQGAWVVVLDGAKRLVFANQGDEATLDLRLREAIDAPAPPADVRRTQRHRFAAEDFAINTANALNRAATEGVLPPFVLLATPQALGVVRRSLSDATLALLLGGASVDRLGHTAPAVARQVAAL